MVQQQQQPTWAEIADDAINNLLIDKSSADPTWARDDREYDPDEFRGHLDRLVIGGVTSAAASMVAMKHRRAQYNHVTYRPGQRGRKPYLPDFITQWRGTYWVITNYHGPHKSLFNFGIGNAAGTMGYSATDAKRRYVSDLKHEIYPAMTNQPKLLLLVETAVENEVSPAFDLITAACRIALQKILAIPGTPLRTQRRMEQQAASFLAQNPDAGLMAVIALVNEIMEEEGVV